MIAAQAFPEFASSALCIVTDANLNDILCHIKEVTCTYSASPRSFDLFRLEMLSVKTQRGSVVWVQWGTAASRQSQEWKEGTAVTAIALNQSPAGTLGSEDTTCGQNKRHAAYEQSLCHTGTKHEDGQRRRCRLKGYVMITTRLYRSD